MRTKKKKTVEKNSYRLLYSPPPSIRALWTERHVTRGEEETCLSKRIHRKNIRETITSERRRAPQQIKPTTMCVHQNTHTHRRLLVIPTDALRILCVKRTSARARKRLPVRDVCVCVCVQVCTDVRCVQCVCVCARTSLICSCVRAFR